MRRICLGLIFSLVLSAGYTNALPRMVIQSGHIGAVNMIAYQEKNNLILSAGDDGTVKIWKSDTAELLYNQQLMHLPIKNLIVHPEEPQFTALVQTSLTSSMLIARNWVTGKQLYSISLNEVPLFIDYSSRGNYLVYTRAEWDSLVLCDAFSGKPVPYLNKGFGIVSFVTTSASEKRIMAYQPSGKIIYKDIATGDDLLKKPLSVPDYLEAVSLFSNSKFIVAAKDDTLVIINITSGEVAASVKASGVAATLVKPDCSEILCLQKSGEGNRLLRFSFNGKELTLHPFQTVLPGNLTQMAYAGDMIFLADAAGKISRLDGEEKLSGFSENRLLEINDLAASATNFAIGTRSFIILAELSLLKFQQPGTEKYAVFENRHSSEVGLDFYKPNKLLIWNKNSSPNKFYLQDIVSGEVITGYDQYPSALVQLEIVKSGILSLEHSGTARIITKRDFQPMFQYGTNGINKLAYIDDNQIIAARNKIGAMGSSLLQINPETGETVPLTTSSLLCYDIVYDANKDRLFSLCIENENGQPTTILKLNYGKGFERENVLTRYRGEDLSASVVVDDYGKYVYSSLGYDKILVYDGYRMKTLAESSSIPRHLEIAGDYLFAVNRNRSITIWDRYKGTRIADLYLLNLEQLQWVAVFTDGRCFASQKGWDYLKRY